MSCTPPSPTDVYQNPFHTRQLTNGRLLAVSASGDFAFLKADELTTLLTDPRQLPPGKLAELQAKFMVKGADGAGTQRLLASRLQARHETIRSGPSLHIIVPTLQCQHTCRYCQVSRSLDDSGYAMSLQGIKQACDTVFESSASNLTVEFQGGDPLLRFDLVRFAIEQLIERNTHEERHLRLVVASSLHQLTPTMCDFFRQHNVFLSTSIDGPAVLHNKNRPLPTRDAYQRTVAGIEMARELIAGDCVSALMTTTRDSLTMPVEIVDEYVSLGFQDIFLRPLSAYGFARNNTHVSYSFEDFTVFYEQALNHILALNRQGVALREVMACLFLNKMLSTFDAGFVDLQTPTGAGTAVLVYNYDGFVYPSDEARMLAEMGDTSLRMGPIGQSLNDLLQCKVRQDLIRASTVSNTPACARCAYQVYCGPDPVSAQGQHGDLFTPPPLTDHCQRSMWLFDLLFSKLSTADAQFLDTAYPWANPGMSHEVVHA